jgi:uncharacterized protein (UPF0303 family)
MEDYEALLASLLQQEKDIQFAEFTNATAWKLGTALVDTARTDGLRVTVDICRNGQQLFHHALPGTTPDNDAWIKRKNRVVNRFNHSSYYVGIQYKSTGTTIQERALLNPFKYAPHGGAFPIIIKNVGVVGTVTASGLPQEEDHKLVVRVLKRFLSM